MSRNLRQTKILSIISQNDIETQEELATALAKEGFVVTQATISRDIKELNLVKTTTPNNKYKYVSNALLTNGAPSKLLNLLKDMVVSVNFANNLIVLKTVKNSASAVASIVEQTSLNGVIGVVGSAETVLIVTLDNDTANIVTEKLNKLIY